ncbi:helix-turn-helix transcriptional regulator [Lentzea sp. NBRC 105346]|uniref:response regulator transcription factor n=1 Tax=Lentzea sp. NBRC 105346 TaxID=3032205 RepID=UPI0024A0EF26|nr:response regulator transcription factor [Lentzea sp. NBRC 105346]GLZ33184.1 helix-turn-helix transcriptional regulator [Lentzea sp. NBRC 105346]
MVTPAPGVALVDPVPLYREGLSALIRRTAGLRWLGSTGHPHTAVRLHERLRPDVLLIDSVLDPAGHLARLLIDGDPHLQVISLVRDAHAGTDYVRTVLEAGARGVVPRSAEPDRIVRVILETCRSNGYVDPNLRPRSRPALSRREYEVLTLIADGLENQSIADAMHVSVETVRSHVKGILRKMRARDRTHAVSLGYRTGLLMARPAVRE